MTDKKDPMKLMRERYEMCVDADSDNRALSRADRKFVTEPGAQWDDKARKARKNRPCYEFPILRNHWRQVCNDQKQARPSIKISAVESDDKDGADLRQGLIQNIERVCNASAAYDTAFSEMVAGGFGAWRLTTKYSDDDAFDQDFVIEKIQDATNRVWIDPNTQNDDSSDAYFGFVEETISKAEFEKMYPKADCTNFDSSSYGDWYSKDTVRLAEYWRLEPYKRTIHLLSDGKTVDADEFEPIRDELEMQGITIKKSREVDSHKVLMSIVSGAEELTNPVESVFKTIPIVTIYGNRTMNDGKWSYAGMVRWSKDCQKLINYNLTTGQEVIAKQHKAVPIVTVKMLEGNQELWDKSNTVDLPYLPITPDPDMPSGPQFLSPPPIQNAFISMAQMSIDMLKASDGIFDASTGQRSNETSGKAIIARQREGDTATFDYQDALSNGIRATGILLCDALKKLYDAPRTVRVLGKDGGEKFVKLYNQVMDDETGQLVTENDLSQGKYDASVSAGASYSTQRAEFVDMMMQMNQSNPAIMQVAGDLIMGAMDFPKSEEVAERLKALLPPQIQQTLQKDEKQSPEVMQMQQQIQQMQEQVQQQMQESQQHMKELDEENKQLKLQVQNKQGDNAIKSRSVEVDAEEKQRASEQKDRELAQRDREIQLMAEKQEFDLNLALYEAETERMQKIGEALEPNEVLQ